MAKVPHLTRVGGQWVFRRAVPAKLRDIIGKREIKHRLGHGYEKAVEACRLHGVETDNLFRQMRQELKNTILTAPTETQLRQIVLAWFHQRVGSGG